MSKRKPPVTLAVILCSTTRRIFLQGAIPGQKHRLPRLEGDVLQALRKLGLNVQKRDMHLTSSASHNYVRVLNPSSTGNLEPCDAVKFTEGANPDGKLRSIIVGALGLGNTTAALPANSTALHPFRRQNFAHA